jgi:hypothetical protein
MGQPNFELPLLLCQRRTEAHLSFSKVTDARCATAVYIHLSA